RSCPCNSIASARFLAPAKLLARSKPEFTLRWAISMILRLNATTPCPAASKVLSSVASGDERLTGLALGVERVEILLQPLLAALSRIDRAATQGAIDLSATGNRSNHWRPSRRADASPESCGPAVGLRFNPKNLGPDQC